MRIKITFEEVCVTPEMAAEWLDRLCAKQRNMDNQTVAKYARAIRSGEWLLTHQAIAFDVRGFLIDGQHRLTAVVQTGATVDMIVARYNTEFDTHTLPVDEGISRKLPFLTGLSNDKVAVIQIMALLERGISSSAKLSGAEVSELYAQYESDVLAVTGTARPGFTAAVRGAVAFARPLDPTRIDAFVQKMRTGEMLERGSPELALDNWLARHQFLGGSEGRRMRLFATFTAIEAVLRGVALSHIHTTSGGYDRIKARRTRLLRHSSTRAAE